MKTNNRLRTKLEIAMDLRKHLANGGTLNDDVTEELYREWNGDTEGRDTELELVEHWAIGVASLGVKPSADLTIMLSA